MSKLHTHHTFSRQGARLALELNFAAHGYMVPYISVDWAWCWGAGKHVQPVTNLGAPYLPFPEGKGPPPC